MILIDVIPPMSFICITIFSLLKECHYYLFQNHSSVLLSGFGKGLAFLTKYLYEGKWLLKSSAFFSKSDISLLSQRTGGVMGIFLLFKNLFIEINQTNHN